jgi:hypothetical protein
MLLAVDGHATFETDTHSAQWCPWLATDRVTESSGIGDSYGGCYGAAGGNFYLASVDCEVYIIHVSPPFAGCAMVDMAQMGFQIFV